MKKLKPNLARAFTLIELLVAITISVVLLSVLAMVFTMSTKAMRVTAMRTSMTERLRALNIRLSQEIGDMVEQRWPPEGSPPYRYYKVLPGPIHGTGIAFTASFIEGGLPVINDVKYEWIKDGDKVNWKLVRYRDNTGYYSITKPGQINTAPGYKLGDDEKHSFVPWEEGDVLLTNVRECRFIIEPEVKYDPTDPKQNTQLFPKKLPSKVKLQIQFGPDTGDIEAQEYHEMVFPIFRGL